MDPALLSRTDLAVHFRLSQEIRRQIWTDGIVTSGSPKCLTEADVDKISSMAKHELDGHTIKNIIRSASRIARSEHRDIELVDVEDFVQESDALSEYVAQIHQANSQDFAKMNRWRFDK